MKNNSLSAERHLPVILSLSGADAARKFQVCRYIVKPSLELSFVTEDRGFAFEVVLIRTDMFKVFAGVERAKDVLGNVIQFGRCNEE